MTHVFVAPHPDDVALSCGGLIASLRELGQTVLAFSYPYGDLDEFVRHWIGACGYTFGVTCRPGRATHQDRLLALPRIEVTSEDTLETFAEKLGI